MGRNGIDRSKAGSDRTPAGDGTTGGPTGGGGGGRRQAVPNANSPQLLTHLLEMIARGVRSTRGLQESLGVDQRTVRYYLQAGVWIGFLDEASAPVLSPDGLAYVYGGPERRRLYTEALRRQPFVADLMARTDGHLPTTRQLELAIARADPELAASTVQRRASAIRGLLGPLLDDDDDDRAAEASAQLALPLAQSPTVAEVPPLTQAAGRSFSPDVYRFLLCFLLDHGELSLGHVRGLLDRAGATDVPLGGYVDLALERGDAVRIDERLVVTREATLRRDLSDATSAVILSDGGWRTHLQRVRDQLAEGLTTIRVGGRYRRWDERLFRHALSGETLEEDLRRVLRDRSLSSWPRTDRALRTEPPVAIREPFLDAWSRPGLVVALPPSLAQLWEGVAGVNRRLRNARHRADAVGTPSTAYRPAAAHGGLLHPGEPLPRTIPDRRTLRQRLVMHAPYPAMVTAALLLHRGHPAAASLAYTQGQWVLRRQRRRLGDVLDVLDGFAAQRGWIASRRRHGGLGSAVVVSLLSQVGIALQVGEQLLLDDGFFHQLRHDDEEIPLAEALEPLTAALDDYLDALWRAAGAPA